MPLIAGLVLVVLVLVVLAAAFALEVARSARAPNLIASHITATANERVLHHQTMRRLQQVRDAHQQTGPQS